MQHITITPEIRDVIIAVRKYKEYIVADNVVTQKVPFVAFDAWQRSFEYYKSLPLPLELKRNRNCFDKVYCYPYVREIESCEAASLDEFSL